jgi:hypothetical protein
MVAMANRFMRTVIFWRDGRETPLPITAKVNRRLGLHRQTGKAHRGLFRVICNLVEPAAGPAMSTMSRKWKQNHNIGICRE